MSISIIDAPQNGSSIQDDLWYIASSDNSGQTNFKYVFDIYDWTGRQLVRTKIYPDVNNGQGYFNAGNVVRNLITYDWFTPANPDNQAYLAFPDFSGKMGAIYDIKIGEDYNVGASGVTTLNMASAQTIAYNWTPPLWKRRQDIYFDGSNYRWLTNRDLRANVCKSTWNSEKLLVPYQYYGYDGYFLQFKITTYNENNAVIDTAYIWYENPTIETIFCQMDIAPHALNKQTELNNGLGTGIINSDVAYYTITESHFFGDEYPIFRVDLVCCNNYTPINLHFMNQYGLFDTAKFDRVNKLNLTTARSSYTQKGLSFGSTSVDYFDKVVGLYQNERTYKETKINYDQSASWKYKLMMNAPSDNNYKWLAELIMSPQIYMEINDDFYPVTITNTTHDYIERAYNGLKNFEIEVEVNQNRKGFKR